VEFGDGDFCCQFSPIRRLTPPKNGARVSSTVVVNSFHAMEEMAGDLLTILDVEKAVLNRQVIRVKKDW
jgi:hypothetical protein